MNIYIRSVGFLIYLQMWTFAYRVEERNIFSTTFKTFFVHIVVRSVGGFLILAQLNLKYRYIRLHTYLRNGIHSTKILLHICNSFVHTATWIHRFLNPYRNESLNIW